MADLQTIYYRIKLDSKGTQSDFLPVEKAIERLKGLMTELISAGRPNNDPLLQSYARQLRDLQEIHRQNRIWFKDVESIVNKLSEISLKELQASLKQTQKEWRDLANSEMVDMKQLEELRRRESLLQEEMERRDLRRRAFAADFLKLNQLNNKQLAEGARQSKALLDTLPKGSKEMKQMLAYATGYANKLSEAKGGMSLGKAMDMGAAGNKTQHTIGELNDGMKVLQDYVKEFGEYMDEGVLANYNRRIDQIRKRTQDAAQLIAETGNLPSGQRATIKQMEEAQRVLTDWQQTADEKIQKSVATWIANINRMVKDAKSAIASAADASIADEARNMLNRSRAGIPDAAAQAKEAREEAEKAHQARIAQAKAEEVHATRLAEIEHQHTEALEDAHAAHQQNLEDATLEEAAAKRTADAHAHEIKAYNDLTEQQRRAADEQTRAEALQEQHQKKSKEFRDQATASEEKMANTQKQLAELEYATADGYRRGQEKRLEMEQRLLDTQAKQQEAVQNLRNTEEAHSNALTKQNEARERQEVLTNQIAINAREIARLEKPVEPAKPTGGMVSAATLYAPDAAMRQAFNRESRSKQLNTFVEGLGDSLSVHLGEVGDDVAEKFMSSFIYKVKAGLRDDLPRTIEATRASVGKAITTVVKQMKLTDEQSANLIGALGKMSNSTMEDLMRISQTSTSAISFVMGQLGRLTDQERKDLISYGELAESTDAKVQKRLASLKVHLRELTMAGLTNMANQGDLPAESLKRIREQLNAGTYDMNLVGIAGRMQENKALQKFFQTDVREQMQNAFGNSAEEKKMANEFFGRFRSSVMGSLRKGVPDMVEDMKPMMSSLMHSVISQMEMTPEQAAKVIQSFEDKIKTASLRGMREFALGMRRNTMGGIDPDGMSMDEQWERLIDRMEGTPESKRSERRERRDRNRIGEVAGAKYKVGDMLTGTGWREGGLASEFSASGAAANAAIESLGKADQLLTRIMKNLRDDAPDSLKQVKRYVEDMTRYVTVDMQKMIEQNGGKLPETVMKNLREMMDVIAEQMEDVMQLNDPKSKGGAMRQNNGLMANVKSLRESLSSAIRNMFQGTQSSIGRNLSNFINEDEFAKGFAEVIRNNKPASRDDMMKQLADYLRQYTAQAVESKKINGEAVEQAVNHIQKMADSKAAGRIMQTINQGEKAPLYDKATVDTISEGLNKRLEASTASMKAALSGTDTKNPFSTLVDTLTRDGGPEKLITSLSQAITSYQQKLNAPGFVDENGGMQQSIEKMKMAQTFLTDVSNAIHKAGPEADVFTIVNDHLTTLLGNQDKELENLRNRRDELNEKLLDDDATVGDERLAREAEARLTVATQFYQEAAGAKAKLNEKQNEEIRLQKEAEEQQKQNLAEAQRLREENEQHTRQIEASKNAEQAAAQQAEHLASAQEQAKTAVDEATKKMQTQGDALRELELQLNNAENKSAFASESGIVRDLEAQKASLESASRTLDTEKANAEKTLARIATLKEKETVTAEENALIAKEADYLKVINDYEDKRLATKQKIESIEKQLAAHRTLQAAAGKGDDEWVKSMESYISMLEKSGDTDELNKARQALDAYREATKRNADEQQRLTHQLAEQKKERTFAVQAANEEQRMANQAAADAQKAVARQQDLQKSIDDMQELNRVAIEAQRNYEAAKQKLANLRAADPEQQANANYQAALAAADKELADARDAATRATEAEQKAMDAYTEAISKNGGVSIAHLKQMRDNVKYLKENVDDNEAIQRYGELLADLDKRIAELDAAPLRKAADVIADADDLLTRPSSRPDTRSEQAAVEAAKQRREDTRVALEQAEQQHGQRMQQLEDEWKLENQHRQEHARFREAEEKKVQTAREAVNAADKQTFIDEQTRLKTEAEATQKTLEAQQQQLVQQREQNNLDRQNAGYKQEADKAQSEINDMQQRVLADQKRANSEVFESVTEINAAERTRTELLAEQEQIQRRMRRQADMELEQKKQMLNTEMSEKDKERLQKGINRISENGFSDKYNSEYWRSADTLYRDGAEKITRANNTLQNIDVSRADFRAQREKLLGQNVLINERNNRQALDQFKSLADCYLKVVDDNKKRLSDLGVEVDKMFVGDKFMSGLRDKYQKIFESVRYNTDAAFRMQVDKAMRADLEYMKQASLELARELQAQNLDRTAAETASRNSRAFMKDNLYIWSKTFNGTEDELAYAKFSATVDEGQKKVEESHKKGKKAAEEEKKSVVELTDVQKKLVDQYVEREKRIAEEMAKIKARADYQEITDAAKPAKAKKKADRTEDEAAAVQRETDMWAEKNKLTRENKDLYNQLVSTGYDMNKQQSDYLNQKREELGIVKKIREEKKEEKPAEPLSEEAQKKAEKAQAMADKKQRENEEKLRQIDKREADLDKSEQSAINKIRDIEKAREFSQDASRLNEISGLLQVQEQIIANAPKASKAYQEYIMAEKAVAEADARNKKENTDDSARALAEAKATQQQKMDALVAAHATEEQKARLAELNKAKEEAIAADKTFADTEARLASEQSTVGQQLQEAKTAVTGYTAAITQAQVAMTNLDKAQQDLQQAEKNLADWDAAHPYNATLSDTDHAARKKQLEDELALARQAHETAQQQVTDTQAALRAAEAKGAASINQLREAYAEAQKIFNASNDQGERDALNERMANIQALINKLNVEPVRKLDDVLKDISGAQNVQRLTVLRQELQRLAATTDDATERDSALSEIDRLGRQIEAMNTTPLRSLNDVMNDIANSKSAASVKKLTEELHNLANSGTLTKDELKKVNEEIFKQEQRYKDMTTVSFTKDRAEDILSQANGLIGKDMAAKNADVRETIALLDVARKSKDIDLALEKRLAEAQKKLTENLNASSKSYISLARAEDIYNTGIKATTKELKDAIDSIEHSINTDKHSQQRLAELTNMVEALKQRLKGDGYDKSWIDSIIGADNKNITSAKLQDLQRALQMVKNEMQVTGERTGNNAKKFAELQNRATLLETEIKRATGSLEGMNDELKNQSDWFTTNMKKLANYLGVFGSFYMIREQFQKFFQASMKYDDQLTDIRKTTDLTEASVRMLADGIKHIDSRSSVEALQALAYSAGKLGVKGVSDIMGFVRSADMLKVSLGEQLGDDAAEKLMKIANIMGTSEAYGLAEAMERTGSAITYLAKNSAASGDAILAFMSRTAGLSRQAGISTAQLSGLAAAVSALNQPAEMSATSFSKMMVQMEKSYKTVGAALKMTDREMETMRLNLETGNGMEAFLDMLRRVKELGGLSQTSAIAKDLGSEGNRVIQTLSTLSSNYETIAKMVNQSTQAFEENITVQEEYKKKNENTAALFERLKNNFAKLFVSPEANDWLRDVLKQLQGLPDAVKELIGNFRWLAETVGGFVVKHVNGLVNALSALFYVMSVRAVFVNIGNGIAHFNRMLTVLHNTTTRNAVPAIQRLNAQILSAGNSFTRASLQVQKFFTVIRVSSLGNIFTALITVGTVLYELFMNNTKAVTDWGESVQSALKRVDAAADETTDKMNDMLTALNNQNLSEAENLRLRNELQDMYKDYLGNLDLEKLSYEELKTSIEAANDALRAKQILEATQANIDEKRRKGAEEQAPEYGKMVDLVLSRLPQAHAETKDEEGNIIETAYSETMRKADAMRIVTQIMKDPDKYLPKNSKGEYDTNKVYSSGWLSDPEKKIQDAINAVLVPGSKLIDQQTRATITNEERIAENVRSSLDVDWMDEMQDAMKALFNNQVSLQKSIEYAEEFGNAQASVYAEAWMKGAKPRMEAQWKLIEDQIQRKGKTSGNGEFDAEGNQINRSGTNTNDSTKDDWARDKRGMDNQFRNDQIQAAKFWLSDARQYIKFLRANNSGQEDTEEIKKLQNKINNIDAYREVLEHKITNVDPDEKNADKRARSEAQKEMDNIIAKIKTFYELQAEEYRRMRNAEELTEVQYQRSLQDNEMDMYRTLSAARKAIVGDMKEGEFWSWLEPLLEKQNIAGVEGTAAANRIVNTGGKDKNGLRQHIGKPLESQDKEDGTAIINGIRLESAKDANQVAETLRKRAEEIAKAWLERNPLGKISEQFENELEQLGLMLTDFKNRTIDGTELTLTQMRDKVAESFREIGRNAVNFDIYNLDDEEKGIQGFKKYLMQFPVFAEKAKDLTGVQLQEIYYKSYSYVESYDEQLERLVQQQQKMWQKMLKVNDDSVREVLNQLNMEEFQKAEQYLQKYGLSANANLRDDVDKKQQALNKANADWIEMQRMAAEQLRAAQASNDKDEIAKAQKQVENQKRPTDEVLSAVKALDDAMLKLRENTWGWLADIEQGFEKFGENFVELRGFYEDKDGWPNNIFGTVEDRQKAFDAFITDLKKTLRDMVIERTRAAMTAWLIEKQYGKDKIGNTDGSNNSNVGQQIGGDLASQGKDAALKAAQKQSTKFLSWLRRSKKEEQKIEKDNTDTIVDIQSEGADAQVQLKQGVTDAMGQLGAQAVQQSIAQNQTTAASDVETAAVQTQAGIAAGSAKTVGELGWWGLPLIAVISATLSALLNAAFNAIGHQNHGQKAATKTKLVSGMLTYSRGNVQTFAARTYDHGGISSGSININMLPVMGDDGRVYFVPEGDLQGKSGMSGYTGMVTRPTLTTVGGAPALIGERGPEMVIGRETTAAMQMYRPDLIKEIQLFDRNRSRGFAKTYDEGTPNTAALAANSEGGITAEQWQQMQQTMADMAAINAELAMQLRQGIKASINKYGPNGLIEETASGFAEARRLGNNKNVTRLFGR